MTDERAPQLQALLVIYSSDTQIVSYKKYMQSTVYIVHTGHFFSDSQ